MLRSFQIENFRLFQHLEVKNLSRVNLIVGKNNSGKSSLLEALQIYASNAAPSVLFEIVEFRQEDWSNTTQPYFQTFAGKPIDFARNTIRHLFFNHKLPQIGEKSLSIGEISSRTNLNINVAAYQDRNAEDGVIKKVRLVNVDDNDLSNIELFLVKEENKEIKRLFRLNNSVRSSQLTETQIFESRYPYQFVRTENISNRKLSILWDSMSYNDLESEAISALKLIDHRVTKIIFIECLTKDDINDKNPRTPFIKLEGIDEPLALKSMGDGMSKLFHLIVALVNAKNGLLLIDEFENGLHWSVQPKIWDIIFQLSEKLNVQVFATTHSRDCIRGFDSAWNKYPELGAFFRLDQKDGMIKATEYTSETLTDSLEMDVEVR